MHIDMEASAEIWSQVADGVAAVWRVYRDDNNVLCRVIVLTFHTPRDQILKVSSTVAGIKPSLICTPGWTPPVKDKDKAKHGDTLQPKIKQIKETMRSSSKPLVAANGLSLTTLLRMAARGGPPPSGWEPRDYKTKPRVVLEEPSMHGDILAKEKGGVKIKWKTSAGISR